MNPITRECEDCADLKEVLSFLECTILDQSKEFYHGHIYGTKNCYSSSLYNLLLRWKRIISSRLYNPSYPCSEFCSNDLLAKARLLSYIIDCSRCPECEEVITTTTTTTFPPDEGRCVTVLVLPFPGIGDTLYPYSYIDCEGGIQTGTLGEGDNLNVCMIEFSLVIDPRFIVLQYADGCNILPEDCACALLTNTETDTGVSPYVFSYNDCDGGVFTDVSLDFGDSISICVLPSTLVTNFRHTIQYFTPCVTSSMCIPI